MNYSNSFMERKQYFKSKTFGALPKHEEFENLIYDQFTMQEMKWEIQNKQTKASGCDDITYEMFKNMDDSSLHYFLELFNKSRSSVTFPNLGAILL